MGREKEKKNILEEITMEYKLCIYRSKKLSISKHKKD